VPLNKVHIYNHGTGGAFGNKNGSPTNLPAALLARKAGKPVTLKHTRKLYTVIGAHQYGTKMKMKLGAKNDGTLTAVEATFWNDGGKNGGRSTFADVAASTWKCANFKSDHWGIATNKGPSGAWRCVQHQSGSILSDVVLEKMAAKLKMNPLAFRRKIFLTEPIFQQTGRPLFSFGLREALDKAAELINGYPVEHV
jgi:CO/xanthine dehydrogenase Mo-binding subunit